MTKREEIVKEVREWTGTPYQHAQCVKGVAVDCGYLVIGVGKNVRLLSQDFKIGYYSKQWLVNTQLDFLMNCLEEGNFKEKSIKDMTIGDIGVFNLKNVLCHVAIITDKNLAVHAYNTRTISEVVEFTLSERWKKNYLRRCFSYPNLEE